MSKNEIALIKVRRETLLKLRNGGMMEIDSMNPAGIKGESAAPVTRYFLT